MAFHDDTDLTAPRWSVWRECSLHWRSYAVTSALAIVAALIICAGIPKRYTSQVKISDEHFETDLLIGLNNMAAWAKGAINEHKGLRMPQVYYRLIGSPSFIEEMSQVRLENKGTDYYHYLANDHKSSLWERIWRGISRDTLAERDRIHAIIHENIRSKVSSKYGTVVLQVTDQDPVVAALLADSVRAHLEKHLADYARVRYTRDLKTAISKMEDSRRRFEAARDEYTRFRDSHQDLTSAVAESMEDHLMNEYDNTFSAYSRDREQYFRAKAFVDKFSLKFAVLKNASVAQEPSGPVTFGYVSAFLFLAFVATTWWCLGRRTYQEHKAAS